MSSVGVPSRTLRRRFTLGSGPLKPTSDRIEFLSRVVLVLLLLAALPVGLVVGAGRRPPCTPSPRSRPRRATPPIAGLSGHLVVVRLLEHRRTRRWERGWAAVEPLWVSRFR